MAGSVGAADYTGGHRCECLRRRDSATLTRQAKAADGEIDEISAEEQTNTDPVNETENTESNQNAGMDESIEVFLNGPVSRVNELPPPVVDPTTQEIPEDVQLNVEDSSAAGTSNRV